MHYLDNKVFDIIDARCNHKVLQYIPVYPSARLFFRIFYFFFHFISVFLIYAYLLPKGIFYISWLHRASTILNTFYYQLMHITLKNAELLKHSKLDKNAPTCFGLHRNHLQGAKVSD